MAKSSSGRIALFRHVLVAGCAAAALFSSGPAAVAGRPGEAPAAEGARKSREFNVAPQSLNSALQEWSVITECDWGHVGLGLVNKQTRGVQGNLTSMTALERILAGTGLTYRVTPSGAFAIIRVGAPDVIAGAGWMAAASHRKQS